MRKREIVAALACGTLVFVTWLASTDGPRDRSLAAEPRIRPRPSAAAPDALGLPAESHRDADAIARQALDGDAVPNARSESPSTLAPDAEFARVVGRVVDELGDPIAGAELFFASIDEWRVGDLDYEPESADPETNKRVIVVSDERGHFRFEDAKPGTLRYLARAAGFAPSHEGRAEARAGVELDLGDLALDPGLILEGRVVDSSGHGVADAVLGRAQSNSHWGARDHYAPLTRSDENGDFRIDTLAPGEWTIRVESASHPPAWFEGATYSVGVSRDHVFQLDRAWTIAGRIVLPNTEDYTGFLVNAHLNQGFEGFAELRRAQKTARVDCDADGRFAFERLIASDPSTTYTLRAQRRVDARRRDPVGTAVEAHAGNTDVVIVAEALASLVFGLKAEEGQALEAHVFLNQIDLTESERLERPSPASYRIVGIPIPPKPGQGSLRIQVDGYRDLLCFDLDIRPGAELDLGVLELERAEMLDVLVVDAATQAPIEGATVRRVSEDAPWPMQLREEGPIAHFDGQHHEAETGPDGHARVLWSATYSNRIDVDHEDYSTVHVEPEERADPLRVELSSGATVRVRVEDPNGAPVAGVSVVRETQEQDNQVLETLAGLRSFGSSNQVETTDENGVALFEHLPAAPTAFSINDQASELDSRTVELALDDDLELLFVVAERADLEVVVRESAVPLVDATVTICANDQRDDEGNPVPVWERSTLMSAKTNGRGVAKLENLAVGEYDLIITHPTRAMHESVRTFVTPDGKPVPVDLSTPFLEGRVTTADGRPSTNALVMVVDSDGFNRDLLVWVSMWALETSMPEMPGTAFCRTDSDGNFELRGLPTRASLEVIAVPEGHEYVRSKRFELRAGERHTVHLPPAKPAGAFLVSVDGSAERRGWGLQLQFEYLGPRDDVIRTFETWIARDGDATLSNITPGPWRARTARTWGEQEGTVGAWATADVSAGATTELVLGLPE